MPGFLKIEDVLYSVTDVPGDGNCFFHCLSQALNGNFGSSSIFRQVICQRVLCNWENHVNNVHLCHGQHFTKELYAIGMLQGNWWATACEIAVASNVLNAQLVIFLKHNSSYTRIEYIPDNNQYQSSIPLLLHNNHFQLLNKIVKYGFRSQEKKHSATLTNKSSDHIYMHENFKPVKDHLYYNQGYTSETEKRKLDETTKNQCQRKREKYDTKMQNIFEVSKKLGIWVHGEESFAAQPKNLLNKVKRQIKNKTKSLNVEIDELPDAPPKTQNEHFDRAMTAIRAFELQQMSYRFDLCCICHERRLNMELKDNICKRCRSDKECVKMFSDENHMNPQELPEELFNLTLVEQQLISRISPCIHVHMLKHGGIASSGHCVTFPQEINEPAQIFPRLPSEINIIKVRRAGKNDTSKEFRVRRVVIERALKWLKANNIAYKDIIISADRLDDLPTDGELQIPSAAYNSNAHHKNDLGPAPEQFECNDINGETSSSVLLPDPGIDLQKEVKNIVTEITGKNETNVTINKHGVMTIPWPTRYSTPLSEFTTEHFFTLAFPCLFPYGKGDFHINRKRTCVSLADWAEHLLWYQDGRFAGHQYFKFVVHNMIMRKNAIEKGSFIIRQQLGENQISIKQLRDAIELGDNTISKKIVHLSATLRGTSQYWAQRGSELRALTRYQISHGHGLPSFFTTGSCAEYHFKPLKRLLKMYSKCTVNKDLDLDDSTVMFDTLQKYTHVVAHYFDLRTQSYFKEVMAPVFGINTYWYRQEFAKSRGMIHWHGLCWRSDREPHNLLYEALQAGLSSDECASKLEEWAKSNFGMTACHPAGKDSSGNSIKSLWPPPEGSAPAPAEHKNPLIKLLMDVSESQESLLEDYLLLTNRFNMHRCSDYCLTMKKGKTKMCRMEFGTAEKPGKDLRDSPALVKDRNGSLRLEMTRDHPNLVQHSRFHTQGWRANGDISIILSKSDPENPSVDEINCTERYITGYACKENQPTGAISDLFQDMVNCSNESASAKSLCNKLLISTVKRDISAVEASFELSKLPLYRCSHTFQSVSLSGVRILEKGDINISKRNALDKYINRNSNDHSSFYEFICQNGKVPVFTGCATNASWPLQDDYCRSMLVIHWPNWRSLSDIKPEYMTWSEKMAQFLQSETCPNFVKAEIERARRKLDQQKELDDEELMVYASQQPEWMDIVKPLPDFEISDNDADFNFDDGGEDFDWTATSLVYPSDFGLNWDENLKDSLLSTKEILKIPDVDISKMNVDQKFAFSIIMQRVLSFLNKEPGFQPLRLIVAGTAGSGKSFLINCLVKATRSLFQTNNCVKVICPTGNSANLISGETIHSFLKIPTSHKSTEMSTPEGSRGEQLQSNCEGLHMLLVDERSLIGASTLGWMEFNARYGVNKGQNHTSSWGGLPIVVFLGDDVQLPPVLDSPVYDCRMQSPAALHGALVWQDFSDAVTLHKAVRQNKDDVQLKEILSSVRNYNVSPNQAVWLQNFQWNAVKLNYGSGIAKKISDSGLHVFPTHNEVWNHNKLKILELNEKYPVAKITASFKGVHAQSVGRDKSNGLKHTIYLCKNAKVMLTCNLCVPYGLFNGATGTVVDIIYNKNKKPSDGLPKVVMVEFNGYTGPPFLDSHPKVLPIHPIERTVDCFCQSCKRKQIPLQLGWATTIHKCQGMTIGKNQPYRYIVINPGTRSFEARNPGALFVALSRAKTAGNQNTEPDFVWHPSVLVNEDRLCFKVNTKRVQAREKEIARITYLTKLTAKKYSRLKEDSAFDVLLAQILTSEE